MNTTLFWARSALRVSNKTGLFKSRSMTALNKARATGAERYTLDAEIDIAGIPAGVHVTSYSKGTNRFINSASLEPNDPAELEYIVTDRGGYPAGDWLLGKISADEIEERVREALA